MATPERVRCSPAQSARPRPALRRRSFLPQPGCDGAASLRRRRVQYFARPLPPLVESLRRRLYDPRRDRQPLDGSSPRADAISREPPRLPGSLRRLPSPSPALAWASPCARVKFVRLFGSYAPSECAALPDREAERLVHLRIVEPIDWVHDPDRDTANSNARRPPEARLLCLPHVSLSVRPISSNSTVRMEHNTIRLCVGRTGEPRVGVSTMNDFIADNPGLVFPVAAGVSALIGVCLLVFAWRNRRRTAYASIGALAGIACLFTGWGIRLLLSYQPCIP
jgi:hypothetical protein